MFREGNKLSMKIDNIFPVRPYHIKNNHDDNIWKRHINIHHRRPS